MFTSVTRLHITPRNQMRQMRREYIGIYKVQKKMVQCLNYLIKWWWIVILMNILREYGDMKILKTIFVLGVEIDLCYLFTIVLYCGCQNYRNQRLDCPSTRDGKYFYNKYRINSGIFLWIQTFISSLEMQVSKNCPLSLQHTVS